MYRFIATLFLVATSTHTATAQTYLFNSNGFEGGAGGYTLGDLVGQNGWVIATPPGTFNVQNSFVASGTQAVQVTSAGGDNWSWPSAIYTPTSSQAIRIQADLARSATTTTGSDAYCIDVYSTTFEMMRFGLFNNAGTVQVFVSSLFSAGNFDPLGDPTNVIFTDLTVPASTYVNFDALLNYNTKTFRLKINGTDVGFDMPFLDPTVTNFSDADFQADIGAGTDPDSGFLDNYAVSVVAIPEPMTVALISLAGTGSVIAWWRTRSKRHKVMEQIIEPELI